MLPDSYLDSSIHAEDLAKPFRDQLCRSILVAIINYTDPNQADVALCTNMMYQRGVCCIEPY